ncbi:MAG: SGNH/GDSL hydrolase family protein [Pseudonocardia sp.]
MVHLGWTVREELRLMRPTRMVVAVVLGLGCALVSAGQSAAAPLNGPVKEYVALGDSYVAGPGIPVPTGQPPGCARSDHNYPSLVRRTLHPALFHDVSCTGATTADMTTAQSTTVGSNGAQLDALSERTDLVTLGVGGNDIGFGEIITTCARLSSTRLNGAACRDHYRRAGRDELPERIKATAPKVAAVLEEVKQRSPDAQVLLVGYPTILPATGPGCYPLVPFSPGDVKWLRETTKALNAMLAEQADKAGAEFVDTYRRSVGHDVCQLPGTKWVEGLVPTYPAAPVHPNALGMRGSANAVLAALALRSSLGAELVSLGG